VKVWRSVSVVLTLALIASLVAVLAGCGAKSDPLQGTWKWTRNADGSTSTPATHVTFSGGVFDNAQANGSGRYAYKIINGSTMTLTKIEKGTPDPNLVQTITYTLSGNTLQLQPYGTFERAK
jgi:hypothetical protein